MLGTPVALDYQGLKILVVDQGDNSLKIYSPEKYAVNILEALDCHDSGDYGKELPIWKSVLSENNNYELAYLYIGKIAYMKGNYREAMKNFEIAQNKEGYSKALRKQQFETAGSLLVPFCIAIIVLILITVIIKRVNRKYPSVFLPLRHVRQKIRQSRAAHEVGYALYVLRHPFDGFWYIKTEKRCGAFTATGCLLFAVAANIAEMAGTPFLFTNTNDKNLLVSGFLSIACLPLIWCVSNWAFTTLTDGKGSFRDIYVYTMISILPRAFSQIVALTVSQFLTLDSATVLSVIHAAGILWMCFLLFAGTLTVHQYSPTKTVLSVLLIILGILVILFMILLSVSLVDKMLHFGTEYVREFSLRM